MKTFFLKPTMRSHAQHSQGSWKLLKTFVKPIVRSHVHSQGWWKLLINFSKRFLFEGNYEFSCSTHTRVIKIFKMFFPNLLWGPMLDAHRVIEIIWSFLSKPTLRSCVWHSQEYYKLSLWASSMGPHNRFGENILKNFIIPVSIEHENS